MKSWGLKLFVAVAVLATVAVGLGGVAAGEADGTSGWALKGRWSDTCSCEVACPCFFGSEPTEHFCEGTSLLEIEEGHYGGVQLDGLTAMVTMRIGSWTRIYVADPATPEQADAVASVVPLVLPFVAEGELESVQVVPISVERTETTVRYAAPESTVEIEIVRGVTGEPIRIAGMPVKGLPFPEVHDHTQYRSVLSQHDSAAHRFQWSGRNGFVARVERSGDLPDGDS